MIFMLTTLIISDIILTTVGFVNVEDCMQEVHVNLSSKTLNNNVTVMIKSVVLSSQICCFLASVLDNQ